MRQLKAMRRRIALQGPAVAEQNAFMLHHFFFSFCPFAHSRT